MSEQTTKVEKQVVSGEGIVGLFPIPSTEKIQVEYQDKLLEFEIRPLDNETFARIGDKIKINNINFDLEENKNSLAGMKIISDLYWPAIQVVLPICCINPRVINGVSTDPKVVDVNRIKLEVAIVLFDKILAASGIGEEKAENRKK